MCGCVRKWCIQKGISMDFPGLTQVFASTESIFSHKLILQMWYVHKLLGAVKSLLFPDCLDESPIIPDGYCFVETMNEMKVYSSD